jgi:uncharacterized sulfatase
MIGLSVLASGRADGARSVVAPRPNIVLILADDLGYGELGSFGQREIRTPNLDRLAAEGMRFTRFYAGSPVCAPSRSVLMTGLHTGHTRVRGNAPRTNRTAQILRKTDRTVAQALQEKGYATALIGKWGLAQQGTEGIPNRQGFDDFFGYLDQLHAHNPYPEFLMRQDERVRLRNRMDPESPAEALEVGAGWAKEAREFAPDRMTDEVLKWVERPRKKPFFLFWSLITPHANNEGNRKGRGQEVPDLGEYRDRPWPLADKAHAATITRLDADVGRLMQRLKRLGIDDNTLVLFTSDNGHHAEGGNHPELFDANGPLRGLKRDLYEGGIRVPTIVRWPGVVPAGVVSDFVACFTDLFPTFSELAGANVPVGLDGISLVPVISGRGIPERRDALYWEFHEGGFSQAVLMEGRWKAIRNKRPDVAIEVYDVATDTGETMNLAGSRPDLVKRAMALFVSERRDSPDWPVFARGL